MAYSLKNHEDRIVALENKIANSGGIVESSLTNPGYVKFSNGLILNFGLSENRTGTFKKPFTSSPLAIVVSPYKPSVQCFAEHWCVDSFTNTNFRIRSDYGNAQSRYIAIGYLITNRLLNYIYAKLNSFKNLKGVAHEQNSDMSYCNVVDIHAIAKRSSRLFNHIMIDREVA